MRKNSKKVLSLLVAVTLLGSTMVMSGCGNKYYKADGLDGYVPSQNAAISNGGFAVEKDGFVYFINGKAENTAENKFGEVVKGSLMRIKKDDLNAGNYVNAQTVVPMLFVQATMMQVFISTAIKCTLQPPQRTRTLRRAKLQTPISTLSAQALTVSK